MNYLERRLILTAIRRLELREPVPHPPSKRRAVWGFLNSAFGLWLLSSVAIGIATSLFTQYLDCRNQFSIHQENFTKLLAEYQYRDHGFRESYILSDTKQELNDASKKWWGPNSEFIHSEFKGKTMADIAIRLSRSFGNLSLYSDIQEFEVNTKSLSVGYDDGRSISFGEPSPEALSGLASAFGLPPEGKSALATSLANDRQDSTSQRLSPSPKIDWLREKLWSGPVTLAVRTTMLVAPKPSCGPVAITKRLFQDRDQIYRERAEKFYLKMYREYQEVLTTLIAVEQLVHPGETMDD